MMVHAIRTSIVLMIQKHVIISNPFTTTAIDDETLGRPADQLKEVQLAKYNNGKQQKFPNIRYQDC